MLDNKKLKVSLLVFSLNEVVGMKVVLHRLKKEWFYERIVIDGGSTDGSIEYARSLGFNVIVQKKKGIIEGYKEGYAATSGDVVITYTPDNNCIPERIPDLIAKMNEGYDMVVVSRYLGDAKSDDDNIITAFGNWMFTTMVNVLYKTHYTDLMGIYRAFRKNLIEELGIEVNPAINTQLCIRCAKRNRKTAEISGDEPPRIGGKTSRSIIRNGLYELYTILHEFVSNR